MYRLKLGLEVHAQLLAGHKLFSRTVPRFAADPNSRVAYFDAAVPGTQPVLSWACVRLALRAALALGSRIPAAFAFDRKHYMYPDQPSGYQITQQRQPIARAGFLDLFRRDFPPNTLPTARTKSSSESSAAGVKSSSASGEGSGEASQLGRQLVRRIGITQIQMEQDTGKTSYVDALSLVDLNRANTGLIELVTAPDFESAAEAVAFVRKLQLLLRALGVSSGEMETGAMRVDVNVSVADAATGADLGERCEIKNLFSPSAVKHAIRVEYARQVAELRAGGQIRRETRGWDGKRTWKLRDKESALDYRYMPDPDIPEYRLSADVVANVGRRMPKLPDTAFDELLAGGASTVDAKTLLEIDGGAQFFAEAVQALSARLPALSAKQAEQAERTGRTSGDASELGRLVSVWLVHRWLGQAAEFPDLGQFVELLAAVHTQRISTTTGKIVVKHMAQGYAGSIESLIAEFQLETAAGAAPADELRQVCAEVVAAHPDVVQRIRKGKKASLGFLLGQVMKETQGTHDPKLVKEMLAALVK